MKDNLPYFSHDNNARRHPKMKALISEFGYEGYGRFWALNERIAETSGAFIDISRKVNKLDLANELGLNGEGLDKFIAFLSDPEIDLINIIDGKITTDRINELFEKTMENREEERNKKQRKKGKEENPEGKDDFPEGKQYFPEEFTGENDTDKTRLDQTKQEKTRREYIKPDPDPPAFDFEKIRQVWNDPNRQLPEFRRTILSLSSTERDTVIKQLGIYKESEVIDGIKNYAYMKLHPNDFDIKHNYANLIKFIEKGLDTFTQQIDALKSQFGRGK